MTATESGRATKKILLLGDLIIDRTWKVDVKAISPEAPVASVDLLTKDPYENPGGAGFGAAFSQKEGYDFTFLTSAPTERLAWLNSKWGITTLGIDFENNVIKTRYIDKESGYHILRLNNDSIVKKPTIKPEDISGFIKQLVKENEYGICTILDYRKGLLDDPNVCQRIISTLNEYDIPIYVDSRSDYLEKYKGVDWIKLNKKEYESAKQRLGNSNLDPLQLARYLGSNGIIVTLSREGAIGISESDIEYRYQSPQSLNAGVPDVTGCGDVFDMTFSYHYGIMNRSLKESLELSVDRATKFAYTSREERL